MHQHFAEGTDKNYSMNVCVYVIAGQQYVEC
jgi:hypothetical protein